jgi:hypothetical protein
MGRANGIVLLPKPEFSHILIDTISLKKMRPMGIVFKKKQHEHHRGVWGLEPRSARRAPAALANWSMTSYLLYH